MTLLIILEMNSVFDISYERFMFINEISLLLNFFFLTLCNYMAMYFNLLRTIAKKSHYRLSYI